MWRRVPTYMYVTVTVETATYVCDHHHGDGQDHDHDHVEHDDHHDHEHGDHSHHTAEHFATLAENTESLPEAPPGNLGLRVTSSGLDEGTKNFVKVNNDMAFR